MFRKVIYSFLLGLIFLPMAAFAVDTTTTPTDSTNSTSQGLTVSPPLQEFTIDPGQSKTINIKLSNPTNSVIELYPIAMDFTSRDDSGDPLFLDTNEKSRTYSLSQWVNFSQDKIVMAPQQISDWKCVVAVPSDGGPGGHYGAIMFSSKPPAQLDKTNSVGISSMVASLLFINVPGAISETATLKDFSTNKFFYLKPPVDIIARVQNSGNTHIIPTGSITIKNMLGSKVKEFDVNDAKGRILPEGTRKFALSWTPSTSPFWKSPVGRYSAELNLEFGKENAYVINSALTFWVIPIWIIITLIVLLVVAIVLISLYFRKKHRNSKSAFLDEQ